MGQILTCVSKDSSPSFGSLELNSSPFVAPSLFSSRPLLPSQTDICAQALYITDAKVCSGSGLLVATRKLHVSL
jgi:hypothetical protein